MKNRILTALLGLVLFLYLPFTMNAQGLQDNAPAATDNTPPAAGNAPTAADNAPIAQDSVAPDAASDAELAQTESAPPENAEPEAGTPLSISDLAALDAETERFAALIEQRLSALPDGARVKFGLFLFNEEIRSSLGMYWVNQLTSILANRENQRFRIIADPQAEADYTLSGNLFAFGQNTVRIYTWLTKIDDGTLVQAWLSGFTLTPFISNLLNLNVPGAASLTGGTPGRTGSERDQYEPDSRAAPLSLPGVDGTSLQRTLHDGDEDFFSITAQTDCVMIFETTGPLDTLMELIDAETDEQLRENDDGGRGGNARILYNVEAGKTYIVKVSPYDDVTGVYGFQIKVEPALEDANEPNNRMEEATSVAIGDTIEAVFNTSLDEDWYRIDIVPSNTFLSVTTEGNLDTLIEVYDAEGTLLDDDDDAGYRYNAYIVVDISQHETIFVKVTEVDGERGAYTLLTELLEAGAVDEYEPDNEPSSSKAIAVGESQARTFTIAKDVDLAQLTITETGVYEIRTIAADGTLDTDITLYDLETEDFLDEDDDSGDNYDACLRIQLDPGVYLISIVCLDDDPLPDNAYTLSVTAVAASDEADSTGR
ncbi:MAG: hypothetical protein LBS86_05990 [Treponema sp.]|jgi:hypothetical protein|nr:hypothetical protein [Treponema sp.]